MYSVLRDDSLRLPVRRLPRSNSCRTIQISFERMSRGKVSALPWVKDTESQASLFTVLEIELLRQYGP